MRTASRRNASVYLFAILYLVHSKHCSKETGTKPRQDHFGASTNLFQKTARPDHVTAQFVALRLGVGPDLRASLDAVFSYLLCRIKGYA